MNANFHPIRNCELIEVVIRTVGNRIPLDDQPGLRDVEVVAIEALEVANVGTSPSGRTVISAAAQKNAFLTLSVDGSERVNKIPVNSLAPGKCNGLLKGMDKLKVNYQKSYITFSSTDGLSAGECVLLAVYYNDAKTGGACTR